MSERIVELGKEVFTTGQIARLLGVAPRTVTKWCDTGILVSHRLPMSGHRRVWKQNLVLFANKQGFGLPEDFTHVGN